MRPCLVQRFSSPINVLLVMTTPLSFSKVTSCNVPVAIVPFFPRAKLSCFLNWNTPYQASTSEATEDLQ